MEGKIQTRNWDDRESGQKKYRTKIIVDELNMLGGGKRNGRNQHRRDEAVDQYGGAVTDDDIQI